MKTLKIDDKWSVTYDPDNNDAPQELYRNGEPVAFYNGTNFTTAMFYALLEARERLDMVANAVPQFDYVTVPFLNSPDLQPGSPYDRGKADAYRTLQAIAKGEGG